MKTLFKLFLVLALGAAGGVLAMRYLNARSATRIDVSLPRADGLESDDLVTWNGVEIGRVETLEPHAGGVRVGVRLDPERARTLPSKSTFKVESEGLLGRGRRLEVYVLDPKAPPVAGGETLEGVGSRVDLALRQGAEKAKDIVGRAADSDVAKRATDAVEALRREVEAVDWQELGRDLKDEGRRIGEELGDLARETGDAARESYERLKPEVERLAKKLDELGRSEEAERLRRRLDDLWRKVSGGEPPEPSGAEVSDPESRSAPPADAH